MLKGDLPRAKEYRQKHRMVIRLVIGLLKGLIVGGLVGFALAKLGFAAPGAIVAYLAAALTGALVGLIAGKPIWDAEARIEAGLKAGFGAILAMGLMWLVRSFVTLGVPFDLGTLAEANRSLHETASNGTLGGLAMTSLALVAGVLGGFYDADNTPSPEGESAEKKRVAAGPDKARIDAKGAAAVDDLDLEEDAAAQKKQAKR
jgi:hypothetical protein